MTLSTSSGTCCNQINLDNHFQKSNELRDLNPVFIYHHHWLTNVTKEFTNMQKDNWRIIIKYKTSNNLPQQVLHHPKGDMIEYM